MMEIVREGMAGWVRIRSWHLESGLVSRGAMIHTLCGKWAPKGSPTIPAPPVNEKSCERCYQLREVAER